VDDIAKLYREFEDAYVDFLTAEGEGVLVVRQKRLYRARIRLLAHKDFTEQEYEAACSEPTPGSALSPVKPRFKRRPLLSPHPSRAVLRGIIGLN
jgi:hypothetical protein